MQEGKIFFLTRIKHIKLSNFTQIASFSFFILFLTRCNLWADAGLPMIILLWPSFIVLLLPIILIEAWILKRQVRSLTWRNSLKTSAVANLLSTLVGIPFTWLLCLGIEITWFAFMGGSHTFAGRMGLLSFIESASVRKLTSVTLEAPWLVPYESELYWMIPTATLVLLIPFFFMSVWVEQGIVRKILKKYDAIVLNRAVWKANFASYIFLYFITFCFLLFSISTKHI